MSRSLKQSGTLNVAPETNAFLAGPARAAAPTIAAAPKSYNPSLFAYNLKASNTRKLRAGLAAGVLGTDQTRIAMCGDSTTAGYTATARPAKTRPAQFSNALVAAGYSVGGVLQPLNESSDSRWTYPSGTWPQFNPLSLLRSSGSIGGQAVFTSNVAGTVAEVVYGDNFGAFTVSIDGGTAVQVTSTGASALATYRVTGLANTTHTITITVTTATVYIQYAGVRQANGGMVVANFGITSSKGADWDDGPFYAPKSVIAAWNPHVSILCLEVNDSAQATVLTSYKTQIETVITTLKAVGDVILCTSNPFSAGGGPMSMYTKTLYDLANTYDLGLIDITSMYGGTYAAATAAGLMYDTLHPNDAGYALDGAGIAKAILAVVDNPASV